MPWGKCVPVWEDGIIGLCGFPYHGHPRGCHNFCNRVNCPPMMQPLEVCLDDFYLVYIKYPIGAHVARMRKLHPAWSLPQLRNILYWQGTARKILQREVDAFLKAHPRYQILGKQDHLDSYGVNMTATIAQLGIKLYWGEDWALQEYTWVLRYAGLRIEHATPTHLTRLRKLYPAIYGQRVGRCAGCKFRPCLRFITKNAHRYVGKQLGTLKVQRYLPGEGWVVQCTCKRRRVARLDTPLCMAMQCVCGAHKKSPARVCGAF